MANGSTRSLRRGLSRADPIFAAVVGYVVAFLVLGGGTRAGFLTDVALQALAVPLLLWAAWRLVDVPADLGKRRARAALLICLAVVALPLVQLIPLPPAIWMHLPGRSDFAVNLRAAGLEIGWLPLSVVPRATWLSALSLLPPMAVFLGVVQLDYAARRRVVAAVLTIGLVGAGLGLLQVAQGPASPLRFYAFTNPTEAVGFFANRNHYAALLYCLLLFAAASLIAAVGDFARGRGLVRSTGSTVVLISIVLGVTLLVALIGAQAIARSRAGLGLTIVALFGALAMAYLVPRGAGDLGSGSDHRASTRTAARVLLAAAVISLLLVTQLALYRVLSRFASAPAVDARVPFARNTFEAALAYMPYGSGMGTFVPVYQAFEKATDNVADAYANHAHNDFLELWLEGGLAGLIAIALFLCWLAAAFFRVWRRGMPGAEYRDNLLAAAALLSLILLLAHSAVDYPLRTTALMAVFAFAAALTLAPVGVPDRARAERSGWPSPSTGAGERVAASTREVATSSPDVRSRPFVPAPLRDDWPDVWRSRRNPKPDDD